MTNPTSWKDLERIRELEAENQRLRKAATEYAECVSNNIPRASVRYDNACSKLGEALKKEKGDDK